MRFIDACMHTHTLLSITLVLTRSCVHTCSKVCSVAECAQLCREKDGCLYFRHGPSVISGGSVSSFAGTPLSVVEIAARAVVCCRDCRISCCFVIEIAPLSVVEIAASRCLLLKLPHVRSALALGLGSALVFTFTVRVEIGVGLRYGKG